LRVRLAGRRQQSHSQLVEESMQSCGGRRPPSSHSALHCRRPRPSHRPRRWSPAPRGPAAHPARGRAPHDLGCSHR
jgi:hypothetical protein